MIFRIDVSTPSDSSPVRLIDPVGESVRHQIKEFAGDVGPISTRRIFLIDSDADLGDIRRIGDELLADSVVERAELVDGATQTGGKSLIEIHLKPGVMDPVAASTEMAIRDMGIDVRQVRTGRAYRFDRSIPKEELQRIASRVLANGVIESVHFEPFVPTEFQTGHAYELKLRHVQLTDLSDDQLKKLSREGHLFLSLTEMKAVQAYFRGQKREPTDIELETIAQTWSEHCVHKTLKSSIDLEERDATGKVVGRRKYANLIKDTIFKATSELMAARTTGFQPVSSDSRDARGQDARGTEPFCLSVFKDNAGVVVFDDADAVCFKVETHNHPSAIEPYGGSATGIGGCIRDVMGTGLGAKPVANTDVFCTAYPNFGSENENSEFRMLNAESNAGGQNSEFRIQNSELPKGVIHPKRVLQQIVAGVRDYGNRMGIPTVNGAVYFDNDYIGNPLVFCGCVGIIPRHKIDKAARSGDAIVVMGGRTGRDGIHGATFSSAELTDTHADEFSHAVQIGNAITQKKMTDVILQARDKNLFTAITDCGAGGLSSAVGEMGEKVGATVRLDAVPLKYAGLRYDEIWISEAQERMVLSVPQEHVKELLALSKDEDVESTVIGAFGTPKREMILDYRGTEVGRLSMELLHDGIPMPTRKAVVTKRSTGFQPVSSSNACGRDARGTIRDRLLATLSHPNVASKHWVIRQYDHEVQGGSVVKPLVGPLQIGPSDASVVRPKLSSNKGVVLSVGMAPHIEDPYDMAIAAIDEAVRNAVCVGANLDRIAVLDNFCWPSCDDEVTMGTLVRACEACYDAAKAYGIPFISGKDSLHNQFTNSETGEVIRIPRTLLISAMGVIDDVRKCVTMDLKDPREGTLFLVTTKDNARLGDYIKTHRTVSEAIRGGVVLACHDVSDGGYLTAVAEMCIASGFGAKINSDSPAELFRERLGAYVLEVSGQHADAFMQQVTASGANVSQIGTVSSIPAVLELGVMQSDRSTKVDAHMFVDELTKAWRGTLDW